MITLPKNQGGKKMRSLKVVLVIFAILVIYINIGFLYRHEFNKAAYYQKSMAAKLLSPLAPLPFTAKISAFSSATLTVYPPYEQKYGSFTNFDKSITVEDVIIIIFWPVVIIITYFLLMKFLFFGGLTNCLLRLLSI